MKPTIDHVETIRAHASCEITSEQMAEGYARIASEITADYADKNPLILCVMVGGLVPTTRIIQHLNFPLEVDYIHATRYRGKTTGSELHWIAEPSQTLEGRHVLIVDDILDEGKTLYYVIKHCEQKGAVSVKTAVGVDKLHDRKYEGIRADFVGVEAQDKYLFGEGMDYKGYWRNVNGIYAVSE